MDFSTYFAIFGICYLYAIVLTGGKLDEFLSVPGICITLMVASLYITIICLYNWSDEWNHRTLMIERKIWEENRQKLYR